MTASPFVFCVQPAKASRNILERPVLWPALTVACLAGIVTLILRWPLTVDAVLRHLPAATTQEDQQGVRTALTGELLLRCMMFPIVASLRIAAFSLLVYVLERIPSLARTPKYRMVLVLCAHAACVQALGELLAFLAGWHPMLNGSGIPGAAWMIGDNGNYLAGALIRSLNVVTLWSVTVLAVGLRVLFGGSSLRSFLVAIAAWSVSLLANLWLIRLMHDALHLRV